jgi:16S rRNA (adenine1518-N6/adenine1519-N6)-dimethyltransferase
MELHPITASEVGELSAKRIFETFPRKIEKKFGQKFLFDEKISRKIVSAAGDLSGKIVTEVGPGPGGLTLEILKHDIKKLYVIELDPHWSSVWKHLAPSFSPRLEVVEKDALQCNFNEFAQDVIISNLPYNISTALLIKWLGELTSYEKLILMFQKEVAERLYATPSTKSYGRLSVLAQCRSRVKKVFDLEPGSFFPAPKVKSTVVEFSQLPDSVADFHLLANLLAATFAHRRKAMAKSLRNFFKNPKQILQELGYSENVRAEEISVNDYVQLTKSCSFLSG